MNKALTTNNTPWSICDDEGNGVDARDYIDADTLDALARAVASGKKYVSLNSGDLKDLLDAVFKANKDINGW